MRTVAVMDVLVLKLEMFDTRSVELSQFVAFQALSPFRVASGRGRTVIFSSAVRHASASAAIIELLRLAAKFKPKFKYVSESS